MCRIKNIIPENVETVYIQFFEGNEDEQIIDNLPTFIKKIQVNNISKINLIKKIPFDCVIEEVIL